jgi:hypothetical protein
MTVMGIRAIARAELRRLGGALLRGFIKTDLLLAGVMGLALLVDLLRTDPGDIVRDPLHALLMLVIGAGYLLVSAAVPAAFVGIINMGRVAVGAWVVLPLVLVPLGLALACWLAADLLAARGLAVVHALGDGFCWTGHSRGDVFAPEVMVAECRGETHMQRISADWHNSAGLAIAYTPVTGRVIVGGYRSGTSGNGWVMSFADSFAPLESPNGWKYEYDGPAGGFDEVTALACQTYECDVLLVSDLFGASRVRLARVNQ